MSSLVVSPLGNVTVVVPAAGSNIRHVPHGLTLSGWAVS